MSTAYLLTGSGWALGEGTGSCPLHQALGYPCQSISPCEALKRSRCLEIPNPHVKGQQ